MRIVIKNGGYYLTGANGWGPLATARFDCTRKEFDHVASVYPQAELLALGSEFVDPWDEARARVAEVERDTDEREALAHVFNALGLAHEVVPEIDVVTPEPEAKPKKRGRRANQEIFSDIANGLRNLPEPIDVSLIAIAKWSSAERKEVEAWLADREGTPPEVPSFVTRDAMKPAESAPVTPRPMAVPRTIVAPVPTSPMADRDPTYAEWIGQAVKEGLVDPADVCLMTDHEAYCLVLSHAPAGWFARARVLILSDQGGEAPPPPRDEARPPPPTRALPDLYERDRSWDTAARMAAAYAEAES